MTAQHLAQTNPLESVSALRLLENLARIHRWILVVDSRRRVVWMSPALSELPGSEELAFGVDARNFLAKLPRPEQVFPLRASLRGRSHLKGAPLELHGADGRSIAVDLDLLRVDSDGGDLIVVIASEHTDAPAGGLDAELVDALPFALLAVDAEGFVRRANSAACRLLEASDDAILARPITTLLAQGADGIEALAQVLAGPARAASCELELHSRTRSVRTLQVSVMPLQAVPRASGGRAGLRAVVLRDVSDERQDERQLRKANDELEHCVGALAHDLRSPLVGLLGFSRLLRQDYEASLDDTGRHFVDRIEQAARTMESLIHDLLELARIGEPGERPYLVDPREVLLQLAAELKPRLEAAGIELVLPSLLASRVYCDRSRLYQVFSNLIGNAIEHMGPRAGARIEVRIDENERGHEIVVADNGRGVRPEHRERIFEIFQSLGTRADGSRGTGMGLAIVKKIAEKHGGRIWLETKAGPGACFHVTLPRR